MNPPDDAPLERLLRSAAAAPLAQRDSEPPFGFETRVLAALTAAGRDPDQQACFAAVFRRALVCAAAVLLLSVGLSYGALSDYAAVLRDPQADAARLTDRVVSASLDFAR